MNTTQWCPNAWASQFAPTPSPDWNQPEWAHRLLYEIPKLAAHAGLRPPDGMDIECFLGDLRLTLIKRSRSPRSQFDPKKGRTKWHSWATMVMRSRSQNIWRNHQVYSRTVPASSVGPHGFDPVAEYCGGHVWR
jgi:hypothetical protein